jgi:hypothetical protein
MDGPYFVRLEPAEYPYRLEKDYPSGKRYVNA